MSVDMMQLQNGVSQALVSGMTVPAGQYEWMRLQIDLSQSHLDTSTGGRHNMQMGPNSDDGLEIRQFFEVAESSHEEFMLDFDLRQGVHRHDMGMMGDQYELHSAMRLIDMQDSGGMTGFVDGAMIDVNHPGCDDDPGGNWAYLFHGDTTDPDDISAVESDGRPGPIATDRVDMDTSTGEFSYHFGYLPGGSYRVAFTCSGEWDEDGDGEPDAHFPVTNALGLSDQLAAAFTEVLDRVGSASSIATNSTRLDTDTIIYQARFDTANWGGELLAYSIDESDGSISSRLWDAANLNGNRHYERYARRTRRAAPRAALHSSPANTRSARA